MERSGSHGPRESERRTEVAAGPQSLRRTAQPDWAAVRHAREIGGKRWSQLEREFGLTRQRIQRRAVREGWRQPGEAVQKATEDFARRFVAREAAAVIKAYRETLDASRHRLALATAQIQALEVRPSEATPARLKESAEVLRKIHSVQSDIGGLDRSDVWRGPEESSNSDQEHLDTVVRAYLDELEAEETPI